LPFVDRIKPWICRVVAEQYNEQKKSQANTSKQNSIFNDP